MASSLSNAKIIANRLSSAIITRRGYASQSGVSSTSSGRGGASSVMLKKGAEEPTKTSWVPDPVTGYYRPEDQSKEIDAAELREILLNNKIRRD